MRLVSVLVRVLLLCAPLVFGGCGFWGFWRSAPVPSRPSAEVLREVAAARPKEEDTSALPPPRALGVPSDALDRVVAVVNRDVITLSELQESVAQYITHTKQELPPGEDQALKEKLLQGLVEHRLKVQEAEREKIVADEGEVDVEFDEMMKRFKVSTRAEFDGVIRAQGLTVEEVRKRLREQLMAQKVMRRKVSVRVSVTEREIEQYVEENREKLETGLSFRARHILFVPKPEGTDAGWEAARARAEEVWAKVLAGEDFAELAKKYSQDPTARDGGDLGALKRGELAPEIEGPILRASPGEAVGPVRTALGYHLFKLDWKESLSGDALTQAKQQIGNILYREKYQARMETWLEELKRRAVIEVRF